MASKNITRPDHLEQKGEMRRPPRVAHFLAHYPALEGTSSFCRGLTRAINRQFPGCSMIITFKEQKPKAHEDEVLLHYQKGSRNPFQIPAQLVADLETNKFKLDGVILHGVYSAQAAGLSRLLHRLEIPYLFVPHDPYTKALRKHHWIRKWFFWHLFERKTIDRAAAVQLLDASHEGYLREMGCDVPVEIISNGCEVERIGQVPPNVSSPGEGREIRVQYLGRMDRNHKGLDLLIEGFAKWRKERPNLAVKLFLTGNDWEDREELERLARRSINDDSIVFTGPRSESSMEIVAEADLVILASRFDGFGMCIVEAMLAGRPVIVSRQAGIWSHIEKSGCGWIVEPRADSIAQGFEKAYQERSSWPDKGKAGQTYVQNSLTWDQVALRTQEAYAKHFLASHDQED